MLVRVAIIPIYFVMIATTTYKTYNLLFTSNKMIYHINNTTIKSENHNLCISTSIKYQYLLVLFKLYHMNDQMHSEHEHSHY